jgi:V/A-type H+-transporting ATPase subunit B
MDRGIGKDRTREDHSGVANQLYAAYAEGNDLRDLVAIVGEDALSDRDRKFLKFADLFEDRFVKQDDHEDRSIIETLSIGWELFATLPVAELKKIDEKYIKQYHPDNQQKKQNKKQKTTSQPINETTQKDTPKSNDTPLEDEHE